MSDDQILSYWQQFAQDQLSQVIEKNFPIEDWIDHLNITLTIAKGRNAKTVRDLVDKLDANRNLQKNILILNQISDLVLTKDKKNVAKQNFFGKGTEINYKKALDLYTLAAEQGHAHAQNALNRYFPKLNKQ